MIAPANDAELMTAEQLEHIEIPGKTVELVRGRLVVHEPPGMYHGVVTARLGRELDAFVQSRGLGFVFGEAGFRLASNPDTVRAPDVGYVSRDRIAGTVPRGYGERSPDLVAEIVSPGDRRGELLSKVGEWLSAGARLVWLIDPERLDAQVFRADGTVTLLDATGSLDGEDVLPGFACPLTRLWPQ